MGRSSRIRPLLALAAFLVPVPALGADPVQERLSADVAAGKPIVAHVVVGLCDNVHQGIVPVPASLGNGQDPGSNLYWGALYGVRTFLSRKAGWTVVAKPAPDRPEMLERIVLTRELDRDGSPVPVYVVADAWDGRRLRQAIDRFLSFTAGHEPERVKVKDGDRLVTLDAGGAAHLAVYVGHNGLMDFELGSTPGPEPGARARASAVLACASRPYFADVLANGGSTPLVLTTGLMAPEAYTLDAALRAWVAGGPADEVREAAARAYHRYQQCGLGAARRLFTGD